MSCHIKINGDSWCQYKPGKVVDLMNDAVDGLIATAKSGDPFPVLQCSFEDRDKAQRMVEWLNERLPEGDVAMVVEGGCDQRDG